MTVQVLVLPLETRQSSRLAERRAKAASGSEKTAVTSGLCRRGIHEDRIPAGAPPPPPPPPPLPTFQSGSARSVLPLKDRNVNAIDKVRQVSTIHVVPLFNCIKVVFTQVTWAHTTGLSSIFAALSHTLNQKTSHRQSDVGIMHYIMCLFNAKLSSVLGDVAWPISTSDLCNCSRWQTMNHIEKWKVKKWKMVYCV